jgi:NitT/TauT family transport system substrate-binding protein
VEPDKITGLEQIVKDAVDLKFTATQLTPDQLKDLIRIQPK